MAYTTINKSTDYFNTVLWTGNGGTQSITGVGHQPDLVWVKERSSGSAHNLVDAVRGTGNRIGSNSTAGQETIAAIVSSFDSDGFGVGASNDVNETSQTYVAWNWKANGQGSSNTDGSINTTYTSVNTTAGFSICQWTGTEANATIGHGLGVAPSMIIIKNTEKVTSWVVYHKSLGATKALYLESTGSPSTSAVFFNNTEPTSSLFTVGTNDGANGNGEKNIAYCFAEKQGYSKFGSYVGNGGSSNFIYTGFKPAFVMVKKYSSTSGWYMNDNKRDSFNVSDSSLFANTSGAEFTSSSLNVDMLSNGFNLKTTNSEINGNTYTYIYMCFAEAPLVGSNNVPCTAR